MDTQSKTTLGQMVEVGIDLKSYNAFLTIFAINLAYRFPDVNITNLESIEYGNVEAISLFSAVCTNIALKTWEEHSQTTVGQGRRSYMGSRQTRVAS